MPRRKMMAGGAGTASSAREAQAAQPHSLSTDSKPAQLLAELRELNERLLIASVRQQELAQEAERRAAEWDALLDSMTEGVMVVDAEGRLVVANPVGRDTLGLPRQGTLTRLHDWAVLTFLYQGGRPVPSEGGVLSRALRGERFADEELILVCPDGSQRRIVFAGSAVRDRSGQISLAILTFRDVTELRQLERLKQDYVSLISHDLRAPLTVILGHAQMLRRLHGGAEEDPYAQHVAGIQRNAVTMNGMIQDLLETSRLEAGVGRFNRAPVDLASIVNEAMDDMIDPEDRGRVDVDVIGPLPSAIPDHERIKRVVTNLLSNALKFSEPRTPVEVCIAQRDREEVVSVTDHGIGIAPQELAHLFEKFYQTAAGTQRGGIGLGLYLARLIVEQSGGRIWATSTLGQRSTFSFSLPIE